MTTKKSRVAIWKNRARSFQRDVGALLANWRCVLVRHCATDKRRRSVRLFSAWMTMIWTLRIRSRRLSSGERVGRAKVPVETLVMTERSAMSAMTTAKAMRYAERGVGAAISGRTSNDMQKARGWDDSGDDCAGTSPDFYPAAPPDPSLSDKFQPQLDVWNCSSSLMLLHWPNSQMPMPRCIFLTVLCVDKSRPRLHLLYLSAMPSEGTAGNVIWTWSTKLVTNAQRAAQSANFSALNWPWLFPVTSQSLLAFLILSSSLFYHFLLWLVEELLVCWCHTQKCGP